eukprot:scaffold5072_cov72-Cylindrotheca_fusiformis.AAC.4
MAFRVWSGDQGGNQRGLDHQLKRICCPPRGPEPSYQIACSAPACHSIHRHSSCQWHTVKSTPTQSLRVTAGTASEICGVWDRLLLLACFKPWTLPENEFILPKRDARNT